MRVRSLKLFVASMAVLSLVAAACGKKTTPTATSSAGTNPNGQIVYSLDQEDTNFNVLTSNGNEFDGVQIMDRILPTVFHADPGAKIFLDKDLMESVDLVSTNPQTVVYKINPKAVWQDNVPFNADDFIYSWQAQSGLPQYTDVGGKPYDTASNLGYSSIASITASPDKFTVTTTYSMPFADWKSLFSTMPPAHLMKTIGWNTGLLAANVNKNTLISAGPFAFSSYTPGKDFIIVRNPKYWGAPAGLAQVDYRFITDSSQVVPALANNEIQGVWPQPQVDLVNQLKALGSAVKLDERPGLQYEHLDFNEANKWLKDVNVRKAIALAIDRPQLLATTVGQFSTGIVPDNNHYYVPVQPQYQDNTSGVTSTVTGTASSTATGTASSTATGTASSGPYDHANVEAAKTLLTSNGYTLSSGANPTLTKGGQAVTLHITSTQGNQLRNTEEQFVANALAPLGIKVTEVDTTGLGKTLSGGTFDMIIFAWVQTPFASGNDPIFQTKTKNTGGQNYDGYSNPTVDSLIAQADVALDPAKQTSLYNQVDALLWNDMATLPLFEKPTLLVYSSKYHNMQDNITSEGPVYNEEQWTVSSS